MLKYTLKNKSKSKNKHKTLKDKNKVCNIWNSNWKNRKITYPNRKHLKLDELDKIPYFDEKGKQISIKMEREEQYVCNDFIEPHNTVLELGARYGVVSSVINNRLENPENHIAIEPDKTVLSALRINKKSHKAKFKILNGVISNKYLILNQKGYASETIETKFKKDSIKTFKIHELENKYNIKFDTLVADIEGDLCNFFDENKDFIEKQLKNIIYEADLPEKCDYNKIDSILKNAGFTKIIDGFVSCWKKKELYDNVSNLINIQNQEMKNILNELNTYEKKITHWIWYVFPTEKIGMNDRHKTYITHKSALSLLENAPMEWKLVLEKICELIEKKGVSEVFPIIDYDRIKFFILFWEKIENKPKWFSTVINKLKCKTKS